MYVLVLNRKGGCHVIANQSIKIVREGHQRATAKNGPPHVFRITTIASGYGLLISLHVLHVLILKHSAFVPFLVVFLV